MDAHQTEQIALLSVKKKKKSNHFTWMSPFHSSFLASFLLRIFILS